MLNNIDLKKLEEIPATESEQAKPKMLEKMKQFKKDNGTDYIIHHAELWMNQAGNDPEIKAGVIEKVVKLVVEYDKFAIQDHYINTLSADYKPKKQWTDSLKFWREELKKENQEGFRPSKDAETDTLEKFGFYTEKNKYFFATNTGNFMPGTNFVIKPLFHIYSKSDNKRLIEIVNEFGFKRICDVPSKVMVSVDQFQQFLYSEGNFLIFIAKNQFLKILNYIGELFPVCHELKTLGWQPEGFWAFSNGLYDGSWNEVDNMGIASFNDENYFLPAFSDVYKDVRADDDEYENDRFFIHKRNGNDFKSWAQAIEKVYGDNGKIAIAYFLSAIFRSDIYERFKIFPHLFLFGEKGSGKSQLGWSLSNVFLHGQPPFNLNSGTDVAFFRRLGRFRNIIVWYDEYTNQVDEKRFQALKSAYDGVGREKGKMTRDSRTEIDRINSAACISGQYLPTRDDNALYTRSMVLTFKKKAYTKSETNSFNKLKELEEQGLSDIVIEVLNHRETFVRKYARVYSDIFDRIKEEFKDDKEITSEIDERILRNYVTIMASAKIAQENTTLSLPFKYDSLEKLCKDLIIDQSDKISSTDALAVFWNIISVLIDKNIVSEGVDFKIEKKQEVAIVYRSLGVKKTKTVHWDGQEKAVLILNTVKVHSEYLKEHRSQYGESGLGLSTLTDYIHSHKAYLGLNPLYSFSNNRTSAHMFLIEQLPDHMNKDMSVPDPDPHHNDIKNATSDSSFTQYDTKIKHNDPF